MGRVEFAFEPLHPVALIDEASIVAPLVTWNEAPLELWHTWRIVLVRAHIRPGHSTKVRTFVGGNLQFVFKVTSGWFVWHINAVAINVKLPSVIGTPQSTLLVPSEIEASTAMWASILGERRDSVAVTPRKEVFAKEPYTNRLTVWFCLIAIVNWKPVLAHKVAHRRANADSAQQFVFFLCKHRFLS